MNPLEIYKHLPRTNCGECAARTCMSFAVSLQGNPGQLGQCPHLSPSGISAIKSMLTRGDWRDDLIKGLMSEVAELNFGNLAPGLGCFMKGDDLIVKCIGQDYVVRRDGSISPDTGNKWINILLLHYVRSKGKGQFSGKWVDYSDLKGGFVKVSSFRRECEEPLRQLVDGDPEGVGGILARLGASRSEGFSADLCLSVDLLPRVRMLILYRRGDDEFPSSLKMLFDGTTAEFIDVESLIFLCEGLVHTVTMMKRS